MHTGPGPEPRPALDQLKAHIATLRQQRRASWSGLEQQTGVSRQALAAAGQGHQPGGREWRIPSDTVIIALDRGLRAGGSLFELWVQVKREDEEIRLERIAAKAFPAMGGLPPLPERTVEATREVRPTDRREFFSGMGGLTAASVLAAVGDVDAEFRAATPPILDLATAESALAVLERDRNVVAPAVLFPPAFASWRTVEAILSRRVDPAAFTHVTRLAGQLAAGLATVASFGGDASTARAFAALAERHAATAQVPMLTARVAGLRSWMAQDAGMPDAAADFAAQGRQHADPPDRARLAAYEAESAAAAGDYNRAEEALQTMRAAQKAAERGPAALPWDPHEASIYEAVTASHTPGRGADAIRLGEIATQCSCPCQGVALAHVAIARGQLAADRPAPDAAAAALLAALDVDTFAPNISTLTEVRAVHTALSPWGSEPLVQELGRRVAAV